MEEPSSYSFGLQLPKHWVSGLQNMMVGKPCYLGGALGVARTRGAAVQLEVDDRLLVKSY